MNSSSQASRRRIWFYEISKQKTTNKKEDNVNERREDNCSDSRAKREDFPA